MLEDVISDHAFYKRAYDVCNMLFMTRKKWIVVITQLVVKQNLQWNAN